MFQTEDTFCFVYWRGEVMKHWLDCVAERYSTSIKYSSSCLLNHCFTVTQPGRKGSELTCWERGRNSRKREVSCLGERTDNPLLSGLDSWLGESSEVGTWRIDASLSHCVLISGREKARGIGPRKPRVVGCYVSSSGEAWEAKTCQNYRHDHLEILQGPGKKASVLPCYQMQKYSMRFSYTTR